MANYGPPGGDPSDPWRERRPEQAYGQPSDPWGQDGWDDRTGYGISGQHGHPAERQHPVGQSYPPAQSYPEQWNSQSYPPVGAPPAGPPPGRRRGRGALVAVLVLLAVLLAGGGATAYYLLGQDDPTPSGSRDPVPGPAPSDVPATVPVQPAPSSAAPQSSADPRFVKVGQCVRNEAPAGDKPKLVITGCAPSTYEVLRRIDGATNGEQDAEAKCASVEGYTNWFFFNSELDTLDYVLCLKLR